MNLVSLLMAGFLLAGGLVALCVGSSGNISPIEIYESLAKRSSVDPLTHMILWEIRFPRILFAALVGGVLSLGGLVFQALLRNPLAEPYILGVSGGSAIGAILGILAGFSQFPGVSLSAFTGSMMTLMLVVFVASGQVFLKKDTILLSGVMVNAFCSALIMFLISMTQDNRIHNILFWLMGDLASADLKKTGILAVSVIPCFIVVFLLSHSMNLLLMGKETAQTMGVHIRSVTMSLLVLTSFMVSATVSHCGLLGFVGLVMPHLLRSMLGADHRVLVPACVIGGGAYLVFCDLVARILPQQGEMPTGVITAIIGAPLFVLLLKRSRKDRS
jgi:iron complex transport system permease protein